MNWTIFFQVIAGMYGFVMVFGAIIDNYSKEERSQRNVTFFIGVIFIALLLASLFK